MSNNLFQTVVSGLEPHVGDILAKGLTKKGLQKMGVDISTVDAVQMERALKSHVLPALDSFMTRDRSREIIRNILRKISVGA